TDAILAGDARACLAALRSLYARGYDARRFCRDLLEHLRHLTVFRTTNDRELLAGLPEGEVETIVRQAARRSSDDLQRCFALLLDADEALAVPARTVDPQLVLEMAVLRLATLDSLVPLEELARRLEALAAGGGPPRTAPAPGPAAERPRARPASTALGT